MGNVVTLGVGLWDFLNFRVWVVGDLDTRARRETARPHHTPTPHTPPNTLYPAPYTLNPTPYTLHPTPYTLHPTPYTLHPTPYTLHPTPHTLLPTLYT